MRISKNFLADFFSGPKATQFSLQGIDHAIVLSSLQQNNDSSSSNNNSGNISSSSIIQFRHYRIDFTKGEEDENKRKIILEENNQNPHVELKEIGPSFDLRLNRHRLPDDQRWKIAMKVPKEISGTKTKNVSTNTLGEKRGKIFLETQDFKKLHTPHHHGLKKKRVNNDDEKSNKTTMP